MWRQKRTTIGRKRSSPSSCDSAFSHTAKAWIFIAALPFHNRRRFFLACRDGKLGMVRKLLGDGAQIDATDLSGRTGLSRRTRGRREALRAARAGRGYGVGDGDALRYAPRKASF